MKVYLMSKLIKYRVMFGSTQSLNNQINIMAFFLLMHKGNFDMVPQAIFISSSRCFLLGNIHPSRSINLIVNIYQQSLP